MDWALYGEGWRFTSDDGAPHESPPWGTVLAVQPGCSFSTVIIANWFYWKGRWFGADWSGLIDQLAHNAHRIDAVRLGRQVDDPTWRVVWAAAKTDWPRLKWRFEHGC